MNCDAALEKLSEHHHETLAAQETVALAEHLGACGGCAQAYCRLQAQLRGIASAYAQRPSATARAALRAAVQAEFVAKPPGRLRAFLLRPVPAYGAALAAALPLIAWFALRPGPPGPMPNPMSDPMSAPMGTTQPPGPARIRDYDATVPLLDRHLS